MKTLFYTVLFVSLMMFVGGANLITPFASNKASAQYDEVEPEIDPEIEPEDDLEVEPEIEPEYESEYESEIDPEIEPEPDSVM